ncbi:MAG: 4Fe-4S cluster-binding domain-containing protein, partial [Firmicutes bacterium]|nr:4Fe-4S cluster-binding domain-containing protein [Bacillota bacterium]
MPPLNLLIKPASGSCNMRCRYCFYADEAQNRETPSMGLMSTELMHTIIDKTFAYGDGDCTIAFQGGEPSLAGLDFFQDLTDYVKAHPNPKRIR